MVSTVAAFGCFVVVVVVAFFVVVVVVFLFFFQRTKVYTLKLEHSKTSRLLFSCEVTVFLPKRYTLLKMESHRRGNNPGVLKVTEAWRQAASLGLRSVSVRPVWRDGALC